jgi:hypothetical protein
MPKDLPIRNPMLSPAGLPPVEEARHRPPVAPRGPAAPTPGGGGGRCAFVTSWGGVQHCTDEPYLRGFCRFHHDCLLAGEISPLGRILDAVVDQNRRREINEHGIPRAPRGRLPQDPLTPHEPEEAP